MSDVTVSLVLELGEAEIVRKLRMLILEADAYKAPEGLSPLAGSILRHYHHYRHAGGPHTLAEMLQAAEPTGTEPG